MEQVIQAMVRLNTPEQALMSHITQQLKQAEQQTVRSILGLKTVRGSSTSG